MAITPINYPPALEGPGKTNFSIRDGIVTLYRRKWVVLVITLPIILAGGIALLNQTGSFWATAQVLVELSDVDLPRWNADGRNVDYDRELSTMFNIAMSTPVAELAAESLVDSIPLIKSLDPLFAGINGQEDLTGFLLGSTNVTVLGESRILEFQVNAPHPRLALMGVGAMSKAFSEFLISGQRNSQAIAYYGEQIGVVHAQVDSLLMRRATILEETGYSEMSDQLKYEAGSLIEVEYKLMEARSVRQALEIRYNELLAALERDPREFPMGQDESRSYTLVHWRELVTKHEDYLSSLRSINTENSIPVRQEQELLDNALANLRREQEGYVRSVKIALEESRVKEILLDDLIAGYQVRQQNAPRAAYQISLIDTEINSLRDVMENLQIKLGEVRLSHQADDRVSSIIPLTNPTLSEMISSSKSMMYFAILVIFALALGVIAAFVLETLDHRISSPEQITEHLQLPVFATIRKAN